jgi:hypothetical protein
MGTFVWWFVREAEGQFSPLTQKKLNDFYDGQYRIKASDGFVRVVLVAGETEDRRALSVRTLEFTKWPVDENGAHDGRESLMDAGRYVSRVMDHEHQARQAGVLSASARIEKKQYLERTRWKPTLRDSRALREAINRKAKREII